MQRLVGLWILTIACMAFAQDAASTGLGGPRKVRASIAEDGGAYLVTVSFIPVRSFDTATNRRLSQEKARRYATEALLRTLGGGKHQCATISNAEVVKAQIDNARFVLVMRVPRKGVRFIESDKAKLTGGLKETVDRSLLLRGKNDYQETLEILVRFLDDDVSKIDGNQETVYADLSNAEEHGVNLLASLRKEIEADRWLLSIERDELLKSIANQETEFLGRLKERMEELEAREKGEASNDR